jgi:hypothetical protein
MNGRKVHLIAPGVGEGNCDMLPIDSICDLQNNAQLHELLRLGESQHIEFKSRLLPARHLAVLLSSFANSEGGIVLFGVDDNGQVVGLGNPHQLGESLTRAVMLMNPSVQGIESAIISVDGASLGCVIVPGGFEAGIAVEGSYYRRIGAQTRQYTREEIEVVLAERQNPAQLFVTEAELDSFISSIDEDTFTKMLLVPLFRSLGFRSVAAKGHRDKSLEYGQDIRGFKFELPTGHWLYFAAQVKVGDISYSPSSPSKNIENVLSQIAMAFNRKMYDVQTSDYHLPDNVFFIASGNIVEGAREYLYEQLSGERRKRILFWDSSLIVETVFGKGLPKGMQLEIKRYLEQANQDDETLAYQHIEPDPPERQQKVLEFLHQYIQNHKYPPTIREIGMAIDVSSTSLVSYYLKWLEERDFIARESSTIRGIYLLSKAQSWISETKRKTG